MTTEPTSVMKVPAWKAASLYSIVVSLFVFGIPSYVYFSGSADIGQMFLYWWFDFVDSFTKLTDQIGTPEVLSYGIPNLIQTALLIWFGVFVGTWYINRYHQITDKKKTVILSTAWFTLISLIYHIYSFISEGILNPLSLAGCQPSQKWPCRRPTRLRRRGSLLWKFPC